MKTLLVVLCTAGALTAASRPDRYVVILKDAPVAQQLRADKREKRAVADLRPAVLAKMLTPRRFVDRDYLASIAATIYGGSADFGNAAVTQLVSHQLAAGSRRGYLHQLLAGAVWSSLFALPAIRQPTLIVAGTDDPIIPIINAHIMARLLPNATLVTHLGGHVDLLTNAATLGPVIEDFLRRAP